MTFKEWYLDLSEKEYVQKIETLIKNKSLKNIKETLIKAVENRSKEPFALLFSGGLDSSLLALICKKLGKKFTCYYIGTENSKDLTFAREIAKNFKLNYEERIISLEDLERVLEKVVKIVPKDVVNVELGILFYLALEFVKEKNIMTGSGAEELFAGYARHKTSKNVLEDCIDDLKTIYRRDLIRTKAIINNFKKEILTPFLDEELIQVAYSKKIEKDKLILRKIAKELGLGKYADRSKVAGQYGSGIDKLINKLVKMRKLKFKKDLLK
jgi:asparagine synthase (glutamine-hydrolysing)